jgi:hypothetical protein
LPGLYPDVVVTCGKAEGGDERVVTDPKLIIEVLSPRTKGYDERDKFILVHAAAATRTARGRPLTSTCCRSLGLETVWEVSSSRSEAMNHSCRRADAADGKRSHYSLTDRGHALLKLVMFHHLA